VKTVTLFVPNLLGLTEAFKHLSAGEIPALKNLQRLLSRAEKKPIEVNDWHSGLASLFQLKKFPAAALRYKQAGKEYDKEYEQDAFYLCADPVYIQPDLNSAVLLAHEELELSLDDAHELAAAINDHFCDENWSIEVLSPHCWVIKLRQSPALVTMPLARLKTQPIGHHLPQGEEGRYWQQIQNEIQMLLFTQPLNERREAQGRLPVNSLWFWGEGSLPEKLASGWQCIAGEGESLAALANGCECDYRAISLNDKLLIEPVASSLLASDEFTQAVQQQDVHAWLQALERFDANWINPLLELLAEKKLDTVILFAGNGLQFTLNRKMLKRWWRRTKPFACFTLP